jgi:hypothetical protein
MALTTPLHAQGGMGQQPASCMRFRESPEQSRLPAAMAAWNITTLLLCLMVPHCGACLRACAASLPRAHPGLTSIRS